MLDSQSAETNTKGANVRAQVIIQVETITIWTIKNTHMHGHEAGAGKSTNGRNSSDKAPLTADINAMMVSRSP